MVGRRKASSSDEDDFLEVSQTLENFGLGIKPVAKDGNCLFRAMADQLIGCGPAVDEEGHMRLRRETVSYLRQHRDEYLQFVDGDFDCYCDTMQEFSTWGGHLELQLVSLLYGVNVMIHQSNARTWVLENFAGPSVPCAQLSYHNGDHYNSVRFAEDVSNAGPAMKKTLSYIRQLQSRKVGTLQGPTLPEEAVVQNSRKPLTARQVQRRANLWLVAARAKLAQFPAGQDGSHLFLCGDRRCCRSLVEQGGRQRGRSCSRDDAREVPTIWRVSAADKDGFSTVDCNNPGPSEQPDGGGRAPKNKGRKQKALALKEKRLARQCRRREKRGDLEDATSTSAVPRVSGSQTVEERPCRRTASCPPALVLRCCCGQDQSAPTGRPYARPGGAALNSGYGRVVVQQEPTNAKKVAAQNNAQIPHMASRIICYG